MPCSPLGWAALLSLVQHCPEMCCVPVLARASCQQSCSAVCRSLPYSSPSPYAAQPRSPGGSLTCFLPVCPGVLWVHPQEVEEDVKKRSASGEGGHAKTLCMPFEQPDLPEGEVQLPGGDAQSDGCSSTMQYCTCPAARRGDAGTVQCSSE